MAGIIQDTKEFCQKVENVFPIGQITKIVAVGFVSCVWEGMFIGTPKPFGGDFIITFSRDTYNQANDRPTYPWELNR